jgi:uncharacterized protein (UPF0335 family)
LTIKHDDEILEFTTQWISIDDIMKDHSEDKEEIIQAVNRLENMGYLESRNIKNIILYKKQNKVQDHIQFSKMMETFVINQKKEIKDISTIPTIMLSDGNQFGFSKKGLELLEHIQEEIDRAHMIIIRTDYQDKIRTLQHPIAYQRIKRLETHINKIMNIMLDAYKDARSNVAIQEYFQDHTDELKFRK